MPKEPRCVMNHRSLRRTGSDIHCPACGWFIKGASPDPLNERVKALASNEDLIAKLRTRGEWLAEGAPLVDKPAADELSALLLAAAERLEELLLHLVDESA